MALKVPPISKTKPVDVNALIDQAMQPPPAVTVTGDGQMIVAPAAEAKPPKDALPKAEEGRAAQGGMPWEAGNERVIVFFQIRMPEPLKIKIDWLQDEANRRRAPGTKKVSAHDIARDALQRELDRMIAKALKESGS